MNTISKIKLGIMTLTVVLFTNCNSDDDNTVVLEEENIIAPAQPPEGFTSEMAQVNGINMRYLIGGEGDPLLLIHGWPQNWYEWHRMMPTLAENYTVIVPTMRGIGDSDKPLGTENYTKAVIAEDMHQLMNSLGFTSNVRVGSHDIGGMVAYTYAATYPDEVSKLAILDAPLPGIEPFWSQVNSIPDLWHFGLNIDEGTENIVVGNERAYIENILFGFSADPTVFTDEELNEFERAYQGIESLRGGFEWYRSFEQDVADNQILQQTKLNIPVLALGGEFSLGGLMEPMLQAVTNDGLVTGVILSNTGHFVVEEQTQQTLDAMTDFFE